MVECTSKHDSIFRFPIAYRASELNGRLRSSGCIGQRAKVFQPLYHHQYNVGTDFVINQRLAKLEARRLFLHGTAPEYTL
jgi:hypothetical protein